ncbi:MAG TPA: hypothetical protein DEG17_03445 [Cyanobacteria bacterium UBA11149]|nr:hypothetical protein [Cyanobacteria bacterium UBA11367]HBE61075.1 hypothetical protein [Cyanobacteria bacterium UBA11366]HBK62261.1 hypothetical protein [Cyanobacteria bacterium UBA11166]HBR74261.1 hypothetical protein [Cyanobacteria bacterium UBA11159]HBS69844.1 hypothetical protein [Cyanobacteria bacterium UBA11153]HBW87962.1 hypothetical protein [Cyanobacteria bacterium UBA11149]HCA95006.1 hypothetical protein [Cyanobacteria bacterium UBA9226]
MKPLTHIKWNDNAYYYEVTKRIILNDGWEIVECCCPAYIEGNKSIFCRLLIKDVCRRWHLDIHRIFFILIYEGNRYLAQFGIRTAYQPDDDYEYVIDSLRFFILPKLPWELFVNPHPYETN